MTDSNVHRIERVTENVAERTEEVVAAIMRSTRDEKIRLEAALGQAQAEIDKLVALTNELSEMFASQISEIQQRYIDDIARLRGECDRWHARAVQLETDVRSLGGILNDAVSQRLKGE